MAKGTGLVHNASTFSSHNIRTQSNFYGIKKDFLELNVWIYEIIAQIQKYSEGRTILKGGAAAQIFIPLDYQRCTADIDLKTDLSEDEIIDLLNHIKSNMKRSGIEMSFEKYIPKHIKDPFHIIPMVTYLIHLPYFYNEGKRRGLKIDFLFGKINEADFDKGPAPEVIGLNLKKQPACVKRDILIAEKLITFAVNSIGLERHKVDSLYKNLYDLYYLINLEGSIATFKSIAENLFRVIETESKVKDLSSLSTNDILKDMLDTLIDLFTWDLGVKDALPHRKLKKVMETCIQRNIRQDLTLDTWAILAMNIYVFIYSIYEFTNGKGWDALDVVNEYIDDLEYVIGFSKAERKKYKTYLYKVIHNWREDLDLDSYHSTERLTFLVNLIENEII